MKTFISWLVDFSKRLLGSSYIVEELHPKGSTPAKNDFRRCKCGETVFTLKPERFHGRVCYRKSCHCSFLCETVGILKDGSHKYKIPRLYDFVIWRPVITVIVMLIFWFPLLVDWHGFGNVFVPEAYDVARVLQFYTGELPGQFMTYDHERIIGLYLFLPLLIIGILIQLLSNEFKSEPLKGAWLFLFVSALFISSIYLPVHSRLVDGKVVSESKAIAWANEVLAEEYESLTAKGQGTESIREAFGLADKIVRKVDFSDTLQREAWEQRRVGAATMLVKAYPTELENYWNVLKDADNFNEMYLSYLFAITDKTSVYRHCLDDQWNVISATVSTEFFSELQVLCSELYSSYDDE